MDVLKQSLLARREALQADMNAIAGAMQQIDWTLNEMERIAAGQAEVKPCES